MEFGNYVSFLREENFFKISLKLHPLVNGKLMLMNFKRAKKNA